MHSWDSRMWAMAVICTCLGSVSAITGPSASVYNAQKVFTGNSSSQDLVLTPNGFQNYQFTAPLPDPEMLITLTVTSGPPVSLYCGNNYERADAYTALWKSDLSTPVNQVFIGKNDVHYATVKEGNQTRVSCNVLNVDTEQSSSFTLTLTTIYQDQPLVQEEQDLLNLLYKKCCPEKTCKLWDLFTSQAKKERGIENSTITDFCSVSGQQCTPTGQLHKLDLTDFNMSCKFPLDVLSQFSQLDHLVVKGNNFTGSTEQVAKTLSDLKQLQFFDAEGVNLPGSYAGEAAEDICKAARGSLISLNLRGTGAKGSIPSCLYSDNSSIVLLNLGSNNFSGSLTGAINEGSPLQRLDIDDNKITGALPTSLGNAKYLQYLNASVNQFSQPIPDVFQTSKYLSSFLAEGNRLTGAIPESLGSGKLLETLNLRNNLLESLPKLWSSTDANLTAFSFNTIRLSINRLQGSFPVGLGTANLLQTLVLSYNNLTGPLPDSGTQFPSLRVLNISNNQLNGGIPASFEQLTLFSKKPLITATGEPLKGTFDVSSNNFSGPLPSFFTRDSLPQWLYLNVFIKDNSFQYSCDPDVLRYPPQFCPVQQRAAAGAPAASAPDATALPPEGIIPVPQDRTPLPTEAAGPISAASPGATLFQALASSAGIRPDSAAGKSQLIG